MIRKENKLEEFIEEKPLEIIKSIMVNFYSQLGVFSLDRFGGEDNELEKLLLRLLKNKKINTGTLLLEF